MREKGVKLQQAQKLVQYLRECEDVMDWINDKVYLHRLPFIMSLSYFLEGESELGVVKAAAQTPAIMREPLKALLQDNCVIIIEAIYRCVGLADHDALMENFAVGSGARSCRAFAMYILDGLHSERNCLPLKDEFLLCVQLFALCSSE